MHIGEYINNYLHEHDMSQRQFAKRCNLSNGYISMLINNVNPKTGKPLIPSLTALLALSKGMNMTLDELISCTDDLDVDISMAKNLPSDDIHRGQIQEYNELFAQLTPEQQRLIISQIKGILSNGE